MIEAFHEYLPTAIVGGLQLITGWAVWSFHQKFATHEDVKKAIKEATKASDIDDDEIRDAIEALRKDHAHLRDNMISSTNTRLLKIEERVKNMPTHSDIEKVYQRLDELNRSVSNLTGQFQANVHTLQLIHEYMLNKGA